MAVGPLHLRALILSLARPGPALGGLPGKIQARGRKRDPRDALAGAPGLGQRQLPGFCSRLAKRVACSVMCSVYWDHLSRALLNVLLV